MSAQSENEEFEFMAMAEEESKRNKLLSRPASPSRSLQGIPESQPQDQPGLIMKGLGFVGRQVDRVSAGPLRGAEEAIQNYQPEGNGSFHPGVIGAALKGAGRGFMDPDQVQSGQQMFARMGVSNDRTPRLKQVNGNWFPGIPDSERPQAGRNQDGSIRYTGPDQGENPSNAALLGEIQDMATPIPGLSLVKPISKGVAAGARGIAEPIGKGLQDLGMGQMNRVVSPLMRHERKANTPISEVIFKYGFDKPNKPVIGEAVEGLASKKRADPKTMFQRSTDKLNELSTELRSHIQAGKDGGARVEVNKAIDDAVAELKNKKGDSPDYYSYIEEIDGAAKDLKAKASFAGDETGNLDLLQAQAFKQYTGTQGKWLQNAINKGIETTAKQTADSRLAEKVNRILNSTIDGLANGETAKINKQISEIIPAHEALGWRQIVDNRKASVSLNDALGMMATAIDPKLAGLYAVNKASKSGTVASWMYRLGEKLKTAKTPEEAAKIKAIFKKKGVSPEELNSLGFTENDLPGQPVGLFERARIQGKEFPAAPPAQFDPLEMMNPRNRQSLPQGQGSIEDMAPPQMAQARQQAEQSSREAFIRQGRERALDIPPKPTSPAFETPGVKVIPRPPRTLEPRRSVGGRPSNFPPQYVESAKFATVLNAVPGRRALTSETDIIKSLKKELKSATTKEAKKRVRAKLRAENYRTPLGDLPPDPKIADMEKIKALKKAFDEAQTKADKKAIMKLIREENYKIPLSGL
jgi:hypothetical protein